MKATEIIEKLMDISASSGVPLEELYVNFEIENPGYNGELSMKGYATPENTILEVPYSCIATTEVYHPDKILKMYADGYGFPFGWDPEAWQ